MALCSFAVQRPVSAHGGSIGPVLGCVIHVTAGEGDPYNEFANPANQVSSHFGIGNGRGGMADGLIEQYVDTNNQAWAQAAGNSSYLSVETEGMPTDPLTQNQILSFARLYAWMVQTHGLALAVVDVPGQRGLITHGDGGAAWGGHTGCPGPQRSSQRSQIIYLAGLILTPPAPAPVPQGAPSMFTTDPTSGHAIGTDIDGNFYGGAPGLVIVTLPQHPEWKAGAAASGGTNPCVGIAMEKDAGGSWGYTYFTKPANGVGSWGPYNRYHINRNGSF